MRLTNFEELKQLHLRMSKEFAANVLDVVIVYVYFCLLKSKTVRLDQLAFLSRETSLTAKELQPNLEYLYLSLKDSRDESIGCKER